MDAVNNAARSAQDTASGAYDSLSNTVQGTTSEASKEGNKQIAKDDDASAGTRASAAKDAVGDKAEEVKHKGL